MTTIKTAFILGFQDGQKTRRHISRRTAERRMVGLDDDSIAAYMNGHDDGVRNDVFRYSLALREDTPCDPLTVLWE